ncbi:NUMOD4 domain-containing protein [Vibrio owensii]|uniref:NUMOD4 domain-containing protein n=1 Tax=Vibrio owensii TaxID=696485 RepID=UPI004067B7CE
MTQEWKRIELTHYSVSSTGAVRNNKTGKILKPRKNRNGLDIVSLFIGGRAITRYVNELLESSFGNISWDKPQNLKKYNTQY